MTQYVASAIEKPGGGHPSENQVTEDKETVFYASAQAHTHLIIFFEQKSERNLLATYSLLISIHIIVFCWSFDKFTGSLEAQVHYSLTSSTE